MKNKQVGQQFILLHEIAKILSESLDLTVTIDLILKLLKKYLKMNMGTIALLDPETQTIQIKVAYGLKKEAKAKGRYEIGEGITGKVVQTGKSVVVPDIGKDSRFLDRTKSRGDITKKKISFICVPIKVEGVSIGALSVDTAFEGNVHFEDEVKFLNIIASVIAQAVRLHQQVEHDKMILMQENFELKERVKQRYNIENMIGNNDAIKHVYALIDQVSESNATVLIRGESGTGKELVANAIHYQSLRGKKPFVKINCSAIPESLLESELFGYEKGAFTGATTSKEGRFEWADGGTIFLDEIGDISPLIQVKLLRVLQTKEFERVGGKKTIKVNIRIVTATNKDLEKEVKEERFREDLYYRINVFPIFMPTLRERKNDVMLLADHFLVKFSQENNKKINRISTPAIDMLVSYHWPGNVRELENAIERAVLMCNEDVIRANHLPPSIQTAEQTQTEFKLGLPEKVENLEKEMIVEALKITGSHQGKTAKRLAITERMLGYKIKKYNIIPELYSKSTKM